MINKRNLITALTLIQANPNIFILTHLNKFPIPKDKQSTICNVYINI